MPRALRSYLALGSYQGDVSKRERSQMKKVEVTNEKREVSKRDINQGGHKQNSLRGRGHQ